MTEPKRYVKKPVKVWTMRWDGGKDEAMQVVDWIQNSGGSARYVGPDPGDPDCPNGFAHSVRQYCPTCSYVDASPAIVIDTLEGVHWMDVGDIAIQGVAGEFYPCKPGIFDQTYDAA